MAESVQEPAVSKEDKFVLATSIGGETRHQEGADVVSLESRAAEHTGRRIMVVGELRLLRFES